MKQTTKQSRDVWDSSSDESNGLQTTFAQPLIKGKRIATRPRRPQHEAQFPFEENQEIVQSAVMFADSPGGIPEYRAPNPSQTSGGLTAKKEASSNANKPWKIIEESKPSRYEGPAPGNKAFKLMRNFTFPESDLREQISKFGNLTGILNVIKKDCKTYIDPDFRESNGDVVWRLSSNDEKGFDEAYARLEGLVKEMKALKHLDSEKYLLAAPAVWAGFSQLRDDFKIKLLDDRDLGRKNLKTFTLGPRRLDELVKSDAIDLKLAQEEKGELIALLQEGLDYLKWSRCTANLQISLGKYVMGVWPRHDHPLSGDQFLGMMEDLVGRKDRFTRPDFEETQPSQTVLDRFMDAQAHLAPQNCLYGSTLGTMEPDFSIIIELKDPDIDCHLMVHLSLNMAKDGKRERSWKWSKPKTVRKKQFGSSTASIYDDESVPMKLFETAVVNMQDTYSWNFDCEASHASHKVPVKWLNLVQNIRVHPKEACKASTLWKWIKLPVAMKKYATNIKLLRTWGFAVRNTDYQVQVTLKQEENRRPRIANFKPVHEPYWMVSVQHKDWAAKLAQNEAKTELVGISTMWDAQIKTFFPVPGKEEDEDDCSDGLDSLIEVLNLVKRIALGVDTKEISSAEEQAVIEKDDSNAELLRAIEIWDELHSGDSSSDTDSAAT